jgi:spermidine synthase
MDRYIRENACSSEIVSLYPTTKIYWEGKSKITDVMIADVPTFGKMLFLDNEAQSAESDEAVYHESLVHPVMASVPSNKRENVLVIGGGEGATVREVLKWSDVKHVDWVDIDGELVAICREHLGWVSDTTYNDSRLKYHAADIRDFLRECDRIYDVVIIDLPDPDMDGEEELYTHEFWRAMKMCLDPKGAFVTHCGPSRYPDAKKGIRWVEREADILPSECGEYHSVIPSFTDDWGFVMSCVPKWVDSWNFPVRFLTPSAYKYIFAWP